MKAFLLLLTTVALATSIPTRVQAGRPKPTPVPHYHTVIAEISAESITVQGPKQTKTYKITKDTQITYNGKKVTAADLQAGMKVSVTAAMDPGTAVVITANKAPNDPAPKK